MLLLKLLRDLSTDEVGGKVVSLEELEARIRGVPQSIEQQRINKSEEDMSAFKKLVNLIFLVLW